ncbi:MAG: GNAT family N-acetyltransferase [Mycobacteriales bacterium]
MTGTEVRAVERWADVEALFGPNGACGGCWCMFWRLPGPEWQAGMYDGNRDALRAVVESGAPAGVLGWRDGRPVGWAAVAPRPEHARVLRSRALRPDPAGGDEAGDPGVWVVPCFYVHRTARRQGLAAELLAGAVAYAGERGAHTVEGYPVDPAGRKIPAAELYTGTVTLFRDAGFTEYRRPPTGRRVVMRRSL